MKIRHPTPAKQIDYLLDDLADLVAKLTPQVQNVQITVNLLRQASLLKRQQPKLDALISDLQALAAKRC